MAEKTGLYSVKFKNPVNIKAVSSVVGTKEGEGPLKDCFDILVNDNLYGKKHGKRLKQGLSKNR